jgi:hypothetical protein
LNGDPPLGHQVLELTAGQQRRTVELEAVVVDPDLRESDREYARVRSTIHDRKDVLVPIGDQVLELHRHQTSDARRWPRGQW